MFSPSNRLIVPTKRVKKKSGTNIIARFDDNSDSTILKFLKFLTKLLGQAIPYSAAIIDVWLDKTFVYFNCSVRWNKWPDLIKSTDNRGYFVGDFMNVGLPREIFINDKPDIFALIALVYWERRLYECSLCSHQVTIDLGLKIRYSSCRKGNISVVGIHSRRAHIQTIW